MQIQTQTRRPSHGPGRYLLAMALVALIGSSEAIVKQQRSDDPSSQAGSGQQHQQSQSAASGSSYNNHKAPGTQSSSSSSQSQSISVSQSAPVSVISVSSQQQQSPSRSDSYQSAGGAQQYGSSASSAPKSPSSSSSPSSSYDSMSLAASNNEQSYQAAANSVNMALANSGIFGNNQNGNYNTQPAGAQGSGATPSNTANLNPLHYYYYPAKDSGSSGSASSAASSQQANISNNNKQQQPVDMMSGAASQSNYPSLAAYPMYADQLNGASSIGNPEAAASNQDASYLAAAAGQQPSNSELAAMYGGQPISGSGNSQQGSSYAGDLSMFSSNLSPASALPAASNQQQQQQQAQQQQPQQQQSIQSLVSFPSSNGPAMGGQQNVAQQGDYLNSHMGGHQGVYPFNQMGDLSTSNFGNNAGGMSQASYMSPHSQPSEQSQQQPHDHFSGSQQSQPQFSLSASQLNPAAVPPPMSIGTSNQQSQQQPSGASSLYNNPSLFQQPQQQQQHQQQGSLSSAANTNNNNNLLAQQYLNSFLNSPYNQLLGQQQPDISASPSVAQPSSVAPTSSGKRFGISSFIMPMLALAGLSLLIPTMSNIGTAVGRKKRSIEDKASTASRQQQIAFDSINGAGQLAKELSIGEYMDKIERYYSIYKNAVENDDCMNRLICEFGDAVKDVTGKSAVVTVIEKLVPNWMVGKVHLFKEAALSEKEGKEKCKKFVCQSGKRQH